MDIPADIIRTNDANSNRRFRNILANSGRILESGEVRNLDELYVMSRDGKLIKISDLATDPDAQTEDYAVKAQADHGEMIDGEPTPSIEKQFGSCKVWLEDDGLHARMYFADDDDLANHAWAISEDASYSTGIDWYPNGYDGAENYTTEPIGILREISMVLTGNDPRTKTLDAKPEVEVLGNKTEDGALNINEEKENSMAKKSLDKLTEQERADVLDAVINALDTVTEESVPEDVVVEDNTAASKDTKTTDTVSRPVVVVSKDTVVKQEVADTVKKYDWLHSAEGHKAYADTAKKAGKFGATFDTLWRNELEKHMSLDGVSGLPTPAPVEEYITSSLRDADGILSHFAFIRTKSLRVTDLDPTDDESDDESGRAKGHNKGEEKVNQSLTATTRNILVKMVYKKLDLDATEVYENPYLIDFRAQEVVEQILREIERAAIIGDGRSAGTPDYRLFDGTRGFYSVKSDAAGESNFASTVTLTTGQNLYDGVISAKGQIYAEGRQILIAKNSAITELLQAKVNDGYLIAPGASIENILGVERVFTPTWMESDSNEAYLLVNNAYKMIGENGVDQHTDFDVTNNTDVLLAETPRGGSLGEYASAVAIAPATAE